ASRLVAVAAAGAARDHDGHRLVDVDVPPARTAGHGRLRAGVRALPRGAGRVGPAAGSSRRRAPGL
ncbi:MAG: hypothetical protein AVDCRST_MAG16-3081, partial [uncultured Frankineae bacterium]